MKIGILGAGGIAVQMAKTVAGMKDVENYAVAARSFERAQAFAEKYGFSKAYAMTGWRLGYACAPETILKQMLKIHQFAIMCAPTTSQYAAVEAMKNGDEDVAQMREEYNGRRRYVLHRFKEMGLKCFEPFGAFYAFPSIKEFGMTSDEFATKLLNSKKIAVVPGTAFGECGEGFLRISYAYSLDDLKEALGRIEEFVTELRAGMDNK